METKYVRVPFDLELSKKITEKSVEGKIVTRNGESARIVCFDRKDEFRPIIALVNSGDIEVHYAFSLNGKFVNDDVLDTHDLMLEIPEYMTFKYGDVLIDGADMPFIYNGKKYEQWGYGYICGLNYNKLLSINENIGESRWTYIVKRRATETEKQELIEALKASKDLRAKEYLKRFFGIDYTFIAKKGNEFNPKDWVLTRDDFEDKWCLNIFSHSEWDEVEECYHYYCVGGWNYECIPYNEQTAHLLGTTENYE